MNVSIFGREEDSRWTQVGRSKKASFQSPLRQNRRNAKALMALLGMQEGFYHSVVSFVGESTLRTPMPFPMIDYGLKRHQRDALIGPSWIGLDDQYALQGNGVDFIATGTDDQIPRAGLDGDDAIFWKPSEDSISGSAKKPRPLLPRGRRGLIGFIQLDFPAPIQGRQAGQTEVAGTNDATEGREKT